MNIRMVQDADFTRWLPLWKSYQAFYKVDIAEAVTEQTWARFLDASEPMHCAVAEIDGVLVGMVHYIFHRSTWTKEAPLKSGSASASIEMISWQRRRNSS